MPVDHNATPAWLTPTTEAERRAGDGPYVAEFIEAYCRITKDTVAGRSGAPIVLHGWQTELLDGLFARRPDGRRRHRVGLVGLPRKNGKSAIGSGIALYGLLAEGDGAEVYSCAADRDQARIVFGTAKRMVELDAELAEQVKLYRDAIEVTATGSVYRVLSSEAFTKEGLSPTLVVYDELHAAPNDELWNVMNLGSGARVDPLVLAITTAGVRYDSSGQESVCYRLYQHGKRVAAGEVDDPSFFFAWWEATGDHSLPETWAVANPGYGTLIDPEDFESAVKRTPEPEFRTKRCNQFVSGSSAWFNVGDFEARSTARTVEPGERVVLSCDGSFNNDSTALVGCTLDGHVFVAGAWERPFDDPDWRVPIAEVEQAIRDACATYSVVEVVFDPFRWRRSMEVLEDERLPVVEFPQTPARMVPACAKFYDAVMDGVLSHDGDPRLVRHVANSVLKIDGKGPRIVKDTKNSPRKIDLAVAAVMAHDRATAHRDDPVATPFVVVR